MHRAPDSLLQFFEERRQDGQPMVLVTVFETEGSTYSKAGAQMLLDGNGDFQGMLSGGCLEGDLAARAADVISSGSPQVVSYDLAQDDELWGLGVGCDGLMRVLLQPLFADSDYEPFATIAAGLQGDDAFEVSLIVESDDGENVLRTMIMPPPRILVLGAGLDAEPLVRMAGELGWRCTVIDHRESYVERGEFAAADAVTCMPADELSTNIDLTRFAAAVVMSHHLASDRSYLEQLADTDIPYIGLLGPANRRDRLLAELGDVGRHLDKRVHGPAGLDLGGRGPAAIALSILAELQQVMLRRSG